jgi:hypothetical protein
MSRIIQSLLGYSRDSATPEEREAYRVANEALQYRVNLIERQTARTRLANMVTTDAFGHAIR